MKRLITAIIASFFVGSFALAETSVGIKASIANMDASGSHTTNSSSGASGGDAVNAAGNADFELASFFIERGGLDVNGINFSIGLDVIPFTAEVDKLGGGDGTDATVKVADVFTLYIQPTFNAANDTSVFLKAGYTQGDVEISDITRQATTAGTASTDGNTSKTLEGFMVGLGVQRNLDMGFLRLEATMTDFDEISHTNSNSKVVKADADMNMIGLLSLVPAICDAVNVPVVASGGVADSRGIAAALTLGASAVEIGTGFLRCPEAAISKTWADAIARTKPEDTIVTRAFSGRLGRSIRTKYAIASVSDEAPIPAPYPIQRNLTKAMRDNASKENNLDGMQAWAGQSSSLAQSIPAGELVDRLWKGAVELIN